ncbi:MAG: GNAT family N-acetyltransferase [Deltaproteobacteria bacterium]|nr:GNAT family N-acetyltransferase [Deltaproteobacteria bacterium]
MEPLVITQGGTVTHEHLERMVLGSEPWLTLGYTGEHLPGILRLFQQNEHLTAHQGNRLAGAAAFTRHWLLGGYLKLLVVDPDLRGGGVGGKLMDALEDLMFQDSPNLFACVSSFNASALAFYHKRGYQKVGVIEQLIVPQHDEILLRKTMGPWRGYKNNKP